jgi:hypothetical protein
MTSGQNMYVQQVVMTPIEHVVEPLVVLSPALDPVPNMSTTTNPIQVSKPEPIIVKTVYTPSTSDQHDDNQDAGVDDDLSAAAAVLVTQDDDDYMDVTISDKVAHHIKTITLMIIIMICLIQFVATVGTVVF